MLRGWGGWLAVLTITTLLLAPLIEGCSPASRYRILSTLFDGVPPPGTPPKPRRRVARKPTVPTPPPGPTPEELAAALEAEQELREHGRPHYESFESLQQALPGDGLGNLDWVAAVAKGLVDPRPALDPETEPAPILPHDVRLDSGIPNFEVVFPHDAHTYWLSCSNCHPGIFEMRAGAHPITMAKIFQGEYCGRCHGRVAFPPETGCQRCHVHLATRAP